jgi:hypothetical protein
MNLDIGVIQKDRIPVRSVPKSVSALQSFATAVAQRYAPHAVMVSHADLALAFHPSAGDNYFFSAPRLEVAANLTLQERSLATTSAASESARSFSTSSRYGDAEAGALFERLFSRHTRVAAFPAQSETARQRDPILLSQEPVAASLRPEVVARAMPRAAATARAGTPAESITTPPSTTRDPGWGTPIALHHAPPPLTLPAPEIKRVADQVMREIDHRIVARRERMGKR